MDHQKQKLLLKEQDREMNQNFKLEQAKAEMYGMEKQASEA